MKILPTNRRRTLAKSYQPFELALWRDTLNVVLTADSIEKNAGGNSHDTGGGFYDLKNPNGTIDVEFQVPTNNKYLFVGICLSTETVINYYNMYGFYFRSGDSIVSYNLGYSQHSEGLNVTGKKFKIKRTNIGNIELYIDGILWWCFENVDTTKLEQNGSLSLMVSMHTQGAIANNFKQK